MSISEIISAIETLSRRDKFELAQILLDDLAREESSPVFKSGQVFPIYTPEYAPKAAAQLAQALKKPLGPLSKSERRVMILRGGGLSRSRVSASTAAVSTDNKTRSCRPVRFK